MTYRSKFETRIHHSFLGFLASAALLILPLASAQAQQAATPSPRVIGTVQAINGKSLTVLSDSGAASVVSIAESTKLLQIEPGKTDLTEARPLEFSALQPGDRVLVRGVVDEDGKTLRAASVIAMKKSAISEKQSRDRAEWQHGVGGLVKSIDPSAQTIVLATNGFSANKEVVLHLNRETLLRRYAPDSTRFDAAKPAPLSAVQSGDQLRARGTLGPAGSAFDAVEIVSGTFRNIAGTITAVDVPSNSLVVQDLVTKSDLTLKITGDSQMRKLPAPVAERLAARLNSQPDAAASPSSETPQGQRRDSADQSLPGGAPARGAGGDFQQMLARIPAASLSDLQKGDAVMVVTTQGTANAPPAVVTLLAGVESILRAAPKGGQDMILSPWTLGGGEPSAN